MEPTQETPTTMNPKGQVTIPMSIRKQLGLRPGDRFVWESLDTGEMKVRKLDPLEAARLTIGAELRRSGITPEQLESILEETRARLVPKYLQERYEGHVDGKDNR